MLSSKHWLYRILCCLAALIVTAPTAVAQNRLAFVAGIDSYEKIEGLAKAVNDAKAVAKVLDGLGYKVSLSPELGRLDFKGKWDAFLRSVNRGDDVVFFFAGHGIEIQGTNYLLPKDTPEVAQGEEILRPWGMNFRTLKQQLDERGPRLTIYLLDACRDNPYKGKRATGGRTGVAVEKVEGAFILYSAGEDQQALDWLWENDPDPNSVFTRRLVPLLSKQGLRLNDLAQQLSNQVAEDALNNFKPKGKHEPHHQRPAYYNGLSGEFCFAGCTSAEASATEASQKSEAAAAWREVSKTNDPAALVAFVKRFKGDFYADLALVRLEEVLAGKNTIPGTATTLPASKARYAFLAGMDAYANVARLEGNAKDVRAVGDALSKVGFTTRVTTDTSRVQFLAEWSRFLERVEPGSDAVFYYSGHGVQFAGENYIVPIDADVKDESSVSQLITLSELLNSIRERRPSAQIAFIDSCRENPFSKAGARGFKPVNGLAAIDNPIGSFIMYAAGDGECSLGPLPGEQYGPFPKALIRHIGSQGLDIASLARLVRNEVQEEVRRVNHTQTPTSYDALLGKFCLAGPC